MQAETRDTRDARAGDRLDELTAEVARTIRALEGLPEDETARVADKGCLTVENAREVLVERLDALVGLAEYHPARSAAAALLQLGAAKETAALYGYASMLPWLERERMERQISAVHRLLASAAGYLAQLAGEQDGAALMRWYFDEEMRAAAEIDELMTAAA